MKCWKGLTPCVYPFLPLHCPTPQRQLSPILLKDAVTVHAYLFVLQFVHFRTLSINFLVKNQFHILIPIQSCLSCSPTS